ncbi:hypothetical protein GCM10010302_32280 [Streptomyces polychromogenes]|uniref:Uncharacterized protein n=2 Tax=Streptomyces TaxID=1883 RepID=A0ABP3F5A0_9ACTN
MATLQVFLNDAYRVIPLDDHIGSITQYVSSPPADFPSSIPLLCRGRERVCADPSRNIRHSPETAQVIRNAHAAWHVLAKEDPEGAVELSGPLADVLARFKWESRAQDVMRWAGKAMSRRLY